jgi:hypothetical protein
MGGKMVLESHRVNVNGASGVWQGTYAHATGNAFYPTDLAGKKAIGARYVLTSPQVTPPALDSIKIAVRPNPYKVQAFHDGVADHNLQFYNLTTGTKITIFDVSGQIIDILNFDGTDPANGTMFWNMFSKDGMEVSSGLYIFIAEAPGHTQTGYFSIIR